MGITSEQDVCPPDTLTPSETLRVSAAMPEAIRVSVAMPEAIRTTETLNRGVVGASRSLAFLLR